MDYNDYELVSLAQDYNEEAINLLYKKYEPIIISKSKSALNYFKNSGIELDDIMQEGFIGLEEAITNFNQDNETSFYTFALLCINRQISNYFRKSSSKKAKVLNDATYIDEYLEKILKDEIDIESSIINDDVNSKILDNLLNDLTSFEKKVFSLLYKGYSFSEIADNLNKDVKSIYNTFQRIKLKFKKLKEDN